MPYPDETRALRRVEVLKQHGTWPGVIRRRDGTCSLTYDPGDTAPPEED